MGRAAANRAGKRAAASFIIHIAARDPEDDDLIAIIEATSSASACRRVRSRFPGRTIVRVERSAAVGRTPPYPDARFIKGRFRSAPSADDGIQVALAK